MPLKFKIILPIFGEANVIVLKTMDFELCDPVFLLAK